MRRRTLAVVLSLLVGLGALAPAAARATSVNTSADGLTATVSYRGELPRFRDLALTIGSGAGTLSFRSGHLPQLR